MRTARIVSSGVVATILAASVFGFVGSAWAQDIVLRYWSFLDPNANNPRSLAQTKVINAFEKANPGIKVKVEVVHWSKIVPMIITAAGAGQAPDVALIHSSRMPIVIDAGIVIPLDPYIAKWSAAEKADFLRPLKDFSYKGKIYSLPWEHRIEPILMYRKDMFRKAGITTPPRTWSEVAKDAVAVQKANRANNPNLWGFVWALSRKDAAANVRCLQPLYWSLGGHFYNPDMSAAINSPAGVRIAKTFSNLVHKYKVMPNRPIGVEEGRSMMKASATAMLVEATQVFKSIQTGKGIGDNLGSAPLPKFADGKPTPAPIAGQTLTITKDSKHPEAAWRFIEFMLSPWAQIVNAKMAYNLPVRKSAYDDPWFKTAAAGYMVTWKDAILENGRPEETNPFTEIMNDSLGMAYEEIITGRAKSIPAALDAAANRYEQRRK